ncbi:MAG: TonB-dependent receptor [Opitutaceae bacterium]
MKPSYLSRGFELRVAVVAASLLMPAFVGRAQSADSTNPGDVVQMSRFDVKDSTDSSYGVTTATSGLKSRQALLDISTPVQVMPRALIDDLGFVWLTQDYARFVASGLNSYGSNNQFYLRGQRVTPMFKNGIQYYSSVDDALTVETVEVVKGINSSLFGSLPAVSGMVMESTKIPLAQSRNTVALLGSSNGTFRTELDFTGPLEAKLFGARVSYRLLAALQDGDLKQISHDDRTIVSPSIQFDWKTTTLRFRYEYSNISDFGLYTNSFLNENNQVSTIGGRDQTYKAPWSRTHLKKNEIETNLITRYTSDFEGRLQIAFYQELRSDHDNRAFLVATPGGTGLAANAIIPVTPQSTLASTVLDLAQTQNTFVINDDYVGNFDLGSSPQQLNFGFNLDYLYNSQGLVQPYLGSMSVINPVYSADPGPQSISGAATTITETKVGSLYLQDQAKFFTDRLILTLGGNWGFNQVVSHKPVATATYLESKGSDLTYKMAAVYKVTSQVSLYTSRATAFVPQGPGIVGQNGQPLPSITSTAEEFGVKTDGLFDGKLSGSIGAFTSATLNQPIGINPGTANFYSINGGRTDTRGLELNQAAARRD